MLELYLDLDAAKTVAVAAGALSLSLSLELEAGPEVEAAGLLVEDLLGLELVLLEPAPERLNSFCLSCLCCCHRAVTRLAAALLRKSAICSLRRE